jgi:hypothetical protein
VVLVADSRLEVVLVVCSARRMLVMVVDIMIKGFGIRYGGQRLVGVSVRSDQGARPQL